MNFDTATFTYQQLEKALTIHPVYTPLLLVSSPFILIILLPTITWTFWLMLTALTAVIQSVYVLYTFGMIAIDITIISILKTFSTSRRLVLRWWFQSAHQKHGTERFWRKRLRQVKTFKGYEVAVAEVEKRYLQNSQPKMMSMSSSPKSSPSPKSAPFKRTMSSVALNQPQLQPQPQPVKSGNIPHSSSSSDLSRPKSISCSSRTSRSSSLSHVPSTLVLTMSSLKTAIEHNDLMSLAHLLPSIVKRNHLGVDDLKMEEARLVALRGCGVDAAATKGNGDYTVEGVDDYMSVVGDAIKKVGEIGQDQGKVGESSTKSGLADSHSHSHSHSLTDSLRLLRNLKHNHGSTALMFSGGGSITMYHLGTIKGLIESGNYQNIPVISGTSGGSITAAMCAIKTPKELIDTICVRNISTDYLGTGTMKRENIRWFPRLVDMGLYWVKKRLLVPTSEFKRCCDYYYGTWTFEEAFKKTGKNVCITVSASRSAGGGGTQRLLLNHISTPKVTVSSAVAASCALPGVMAPAKLEMKGDDGELSLFQVDGVEWIDGSIQADLPFRRIGTMFNVTNFIVAQVNFHVVPFIKKEHSPGLKSTYWKVFQMLEWDIRSRVLQLSRLGLFPRFFGQDISKIFKQKYHGNVTLVPKMNMMQIIGVKALLNPTIKDMEHYLRKGQECVWPYCKLIKHMLIHEEALQNAISALESELKTLEGGKVTRGNRPRSLSEAREVELLKDTVLRQEKEIAVLKKQLKKQGGGLPPPVPSTEQGSSGEGGENENENENDNDNWGRRGREKSGEWTTVRRRGSSFTRSNGKKEE